MKRPYLRTGCLADFICDRFLNTPLHNEEHAQAVNELYCMVVQILFDGPWIFRPIVLKSFPRYEPSRGQRHEWQKKWAAWVTKLTKREGKALRYETPVCWPKQLPLGKRRLAGAHNISPNNES